MVPSSATMACGTPDWANRATYVSVLSSAPTYRGSGLNAPGPVGRISRLRCGPHHPRHTSCPEPGSAQGSRSGQLRLCDVGGVPVAERRPNSEADRPEPEQEEREEERGEDPARAGEV